MSATRERREQNSGVYFPPVAALFQGGIWPSSVALQSLISEIDNQLDANTKDLDNCLQSVLNATNRLPGSRTFSTPKDALGYMCSSHTLEKDTCYDPEPDEAIAIIKALCDSLEKNPGTEESILQEILSLASDEGLILPLKCTPLGALSQSSSSLNMQIDSIDQVMEGKWGKLTQGLQKHLVSELLKLLPISHDHNFAWALIERRLELVGGLRSLASDDEAWITYRNVRGQQLEQLFNSLLPDNDSENVNHKEFCCNCDTVATKIIEMMEEDFAVLCSGVFKKIGGVYRILHDLYLEKYSDEMSLLVEEIADDIRDFNKKMVKTSKSDHGINKTHGRSGPRGSLGGIFSSPPASPGQDIWAQKTPVNSHSLDTMFLASSYKAEIEKGSSGARIQKQSSMAFPKDCITSIRFIVLSLLKLEGFLEDLCKRTSWDVTGLPARKNRKKSSLRGVLKPCASPELRRHSLNLGSSFSSSDTQLDTSNTAGRNSPIAHVDVAPAPKVIERNRSEDRVRWDWRLIFKKISSGLASAVETKIEYSMTLALNRESTSWEEKRVLETVSLDFVQYGENMDHPFVISKEVDEFIQSIHELLPLARAGMDGCLIHVRTAFIDSLGIAVKNLHLHCVSLSKVIPSKSTVKQMLIIISNAVYIKNYLHHVEKTLSAEENGKKFMSSLLKQYTDLVEGLGKHLLQLHNQLIATAVLCDAESGNWSDLKEFYEDERCSFSIQMWNFHLRGTRHDMWQILPPKLSQSLFSAILQDSLLLLMQRYARVKPSFRRVKQFKYDITAILLCLTDHLLTSSHSISQVLDPGHNELPHYSIHNQASNLLACLAVISSPIEVLYRIFKRGYDRRPQSRGSSESPVYSGNTQWLHWIWPSLFHSGTKHYDDMQTAAALFLHMRLLMSQPIIGGRLVTQALLMKNYTLSILLLTRTCLQETSRTSKLALYLSKSKPVSKASSKDKDDDISSPPAKLLAAHQSQSSTDSTGSQSNSPSSPMGPQKIGVKEEKAKNPVSDIQRVSDAVIHVTSHLQFFPDALAKCIVPTIERSVCWEMFNVKNPLISPEMEVPEWLISIFHLMEPFTCRVLEPMLRYLMKVKTADSYIKPVISFVADLPCGCPPNYSLKDHPKPPTVKDVLLQCMKLVVIEIENSVIILPASICSLFSALETNCRDQGIKTSHRCVALHIIAWGLWRQLNSIGAGKEPVGEMLKAHFKSHLAGLADSLFHVLVFGKGSNTPRFAAKFMKNNKEWLQYKIQSISAFIANDLHSTPAMDVTESATNAYCDHLFITIASTLMEGERGHDYLRLLCHLLLNNSHWLLEQMDIQAPLASPVSSVKKHSFKLDLAQPVRSSTPFDPMKEMNSIGMGSFNQTAITEFIYDWVALLTSDLGLSRAAFRSLLMNRWEMQDDAVLQETEKKPVDVLKAVYEYS